MSVASFRSRGLLGMIVVGAAMLCAASPSFGQAAPGQPAQPGQQGQGGGRNRGQNGQQRDPQQFRQQMQDRMREAMGATPEEWTLLQPKIEKVQQLQRAACALGHPPGQQRGRERHRRELWRQRSGARTAGRAREHGTQ